ncbi:MAG: tetratricopeptide repeat protein, partial [Planctomycetota bacterium]
LGHVGDVLRDLGRLEKAAATYEQALALDPDDKRILCNVGDVYNSLGQPDRAMPYLIKSIDIDEDYAVAHHNLAVSLTKKQQFAAAEKSLRRALELEPKHPSRTHYQLGVVLGRQRRFEEAIKSQQRALAEDPDNLDAYAHLGLVYLKLGDPAKSVQSYDRALAIDPTHERCQYNRCAVLIDLGKVDEARRGLEQLLEQNPRHAGALTNLGLILKNQGRTGEAAEYLDRALGVAPDLAPTWFNLGELRMSRGELDAAREAFEAAEREFGKGDGNRYIRARYWRARSLLNMGWIHSQGGDSEKAFATVRRAADVAPKDPDVRTAVGATLGQMGRDAEAIEEFERALAIEPDHLMALNYLSGALIRQGRPTEAMQSLERAANLRADAPPLSNLGDVYRDRGWIVKSAAAYERAARIFGEQQTSFAKTWGERAEKSAKELQDSLKVAKDSLTGAREVGNRMEFRAAVSWGVAQGRHAEVVRLTEQVLLENQDWLTDEEWGAYDPSRSAALLAAREGLADEERARLRELARTWLTREVTRWQKWLDAESGQAAEARARFAVCAKEPALAGLRDEGLDALSEDEQTAWKSLWARVRATAK